MTERLLMPAFGLAVFGLVMVAYPLGIILVPCQSQDDDGNVDHEFFEEGVRVKRNQFVVSQLSDVCYVEFLMLIPLCGWTILVISAISQARSLYQVCTPATLGQSCAFSNR